VLRKKIITTLFLFFISSQTEARLLDTDWDEQLAFDQLVSCGLVEKPFYGQRPWTHQTIIRSLESVKSFSGHSACSQEVVDGLLRNFEDYRKTLSSSQPNDQSKIHIKPIEGISFSYNYLSGGSLSYVNNNRGTVDAIANTFLENTAQKVRGEGHNVLFSSAHYFSWYGQDLYLEPLLGVLGSNDLLRVDDAVVTWQQAYAHFNKWRMDMIVGRSPVLWGQGEHGGLLFTDNARPLDVIQLTNAQPVRFPWLFGRLGVFKFSFVFGTLGPEQFFPHTLFSGLSLGYKPASFLEFNLSHVLQFGGEGAPDLGFTTGLREFFGFIPGISQTAVRGGNKITGFNLRFFADRLMGLQGYLEYAMDDSNLSGGSAALKKHFTANSSYLVGLFFTRPFGLTVDSLRVEMTRFGQIAYRHSLYDGGWTINQHIIGHPSGPDSYSARVAWEHDWSTFRDRSKVFFQWTSRDSDTYQVSADGYTETVLNEGPSEQRYAAMAEHAFDWMRLQWKVGAGFEIIQNYRYVEGNRSGTLLLSSQINKTF